LQSSIRDALLYYNLKRAHLSTVQRTQYSILLLTVCKIELGEVFCYIQDIFNEKHVFYVNFYVFFIIFYDCLSYAKIIVKLLCFIVKLLRL